METASKTSGLAQSPYRQAGSGRLPRRVIRDPFDTVRRTLNTIFKMEISPADGGPGGTELSAVTRSVLGLVAAAVIATGVPAAWAEDDAAMKARMAELERENKEMKEEMQALRELLEASIQKKPAAHPVPAPDTDAEATAEAPRVEEVERQQGVLTEELRKIKEALVLPEHKELKSEYGLGPAASKVYGVTRGLSLGGYGEFNYRNTVSDRGTSSRDEFDMLRLVLYTGYKFNDWILFNSEVEFEHGSTGNRGSVSVEFANLDFMFHEMINARAGLVLVPMGFVNEIHEPPFFHGNVRPEVETAILPSTWRAGGAGFFGELLPGLEYRTYMITGLNARGFSASGIRGGRQNGSFERAEDFAWVGRVDYSPLDMLTVGGSAYLGNSGQDQQFGNSTDGFTRPDVFTQIYEVHGQLRTHGFESRLLAAWVDIDDANEISLDSTINPHVTDPTKKDQPVAGKQFGWYGEVAYNVLPLFLDTDHYLAPWFRYSRVDTQGDVPFGFEDDDNRDRDVYEVGLSYKPIPEVIIKLDYRNLEPKEGELPDEVRLGAGFAY
jgi:hypothetical protein